jgi:hypothetical protein
MYICIMYMCTHIYTYIYMYIYTYVYIHTYIHMYFNVHINIHICIHIYTYLHTNTSMYVLLTHVEMIQMMQAIIEICLCVNNIHTYIHMYA